MRRISTATRVIDKFGTGKDGFTNGDAVSGLPSTDLEDVWFDHVQEEIAGVVEATGAALDGANRGQLLAAIQAMFAPVIGSARNLKMSVTAASASATLTADEITVGTALGGKKFLLANFNKTINLATTGAGGMDTGSAPVSGFVALYAIYNPTTQTAALLAQNASTLRANVYSGANMPAGYTASALVSVWRTNGSGQFVQAFQRDRNVTFPVVSVLSAGIATTYTAVSLSGVVPVNATFWEGTLDALPGSPSNGIFVAADSNGTGLQVAVSPATGGHVGGVCRLPIITSQTAYYLNTVTSSQGSINVNGYDF